MLPDPFLTEKELKEMNRRNYVGFSFMQKWFHPPMWYFVNASARIHDENYRKGGTKYDRLVADLGFYRRIIKDVNLITDNRLKIKAYYIAKLYYTLIRSFGWIAFNYKKPCQN